MGGLVHGRGWWVTVWLRTLTVCGGGDRLLYLKKSGAWDTASLSYFQVFFFFSSRRRHTRFKCDWSSDVCSSDLGTTSLTFVAATYFRQAHRLTCSEIRGRNKRQRCSAGISADGSISSTRGTSDQIGRASCRERV